MEIPHIYQHIRSRDIDRGEGMRHFEHPEHGHRNGLPPVFALKRLAKEPTVAKVDRPKSYIPRGDPSMTEPGEHNAVHPAATFLSW